MPAQGHIPGDDAPTLQAIDSHGRPADMAVLEEAGVAFDPTTQHLDLTKDEKRRTTALMMAIQAYSNLIIKDALYLEKAADLARRNEGPVIRPATMNAMVEAAIQFDFFIAGGYGAANPREMESRDNDDQAADG